MAMLVDKIGEKKLIQGTEPMHTRSQATTVTNKAKQADKHTQTNSHRLTEFFFLMKA
jgi:hypothetical protein